MNFNNKKRTINIHEMLEKGNNSSKKLYPAATKTTMKSKYKFTNKKSRRCSNARPLPSLVDLERMFEDSNDNSIDINSNTSAVNNNQSSQDLQLQFSPTEFKDIPKYPNAQTIESTYKESLNTQDSFSQTQEQASGLYTKFSNDKLFEIKKSTEFVSNENDCTIDLTDETDEIPFDECKRINHMDSKVKISAETLNKSNNSERNEDENHSDCSDKTIIYDYGTCQKFSPLPSTSTDMETIMKNDDNLSNSFICAIETKHLPETNDSFNYTDVLIELTDHKNEVEKAKPILIENIDSTDNDIQIIDEVFIIDEDKTNIGENDKKQKTEVIKKKKVKNTYLPAKNDITVIIDDDNDYSNNVITTLQPQEECECVEIICENSNLKDVRPERFTSKITNTKTNNQFIEVSDDSDVISILLDLNHSPIHTNCRTISTNTSVGNVNYSTQNSSANNAIESFNLTKESLSLNNKVSNSSKRLLVETSICEDLNKIQTEKPRTGIGDCPICLDSLLNNNIVSTICGHLFCKKCIDAALKQSNKRCPTCRKYLRNKHSYHPIFL